MDYGRFMRAAAAGNIEEIETLYQRVREQKVKITDLPEEIVERFAEHDALLGDE